MSSAILAVALNLSADERIALMQSLLDSLKSPTPKASKPAAKPAAKPKKGSAEVAEKPKEADKPKEATWWVKATGHVRGVLKPATDAHNAALAEGSKKVTGTAALSVASALKKAGLLAEGMMPSDAQILAAFKSHLEQPPTPKDGSTTSTASGGAKPKAAKPELTEEQAVAVKAAKAAKAKATREANKAKKAATPVIEGFTAEMHWFHEGRSYSRVGNDLWDAANNAWIGTYDPETNSIDLTADEPERIYA